MEINEEITIPIESERHWGSKSIFVVANARYRFTPSGQWKDWKNTCGAEGYIKPYLKITSSLLRHKNGLYFSLIASIDKRKNFEILEPIEKTMEQDGELFFYANDIFGFYWNNCGSLSLTIKRIS